MTEQVPQRGPDERDPEPDTTPPGHEPIASTEPTRTGVAAVDQVLEEVDRLDELPLDEHPSAFEHAHDALRSALDAEPGEPA
jgi:hypothetical protein